MSNHSPIALIMARPLSSEKRLAILQAAVAVVAEAGTAAPTQQVAKRAGVAEGTVFTYFSTKDALLNEAFIHLEEQLAAAVNEGFPWGADAQAQVHHVWDALFMWGRSNRSAYRALRQLKVSERIDSQTKEKCGLFFDRALRSLSQALSDKVNADALPFFLNHALLGLVDTALDASEATPDQAPVVSATARKLFWNGMIN